VRAVGQGVARDMLLTGLRISGVDAHRWGLVSRLVEDALPETARSLTKTIEDGAHEATSATKLLAFHASNEDMIIGLRAESSAWSNVRASDNAQEGLSAFLEKRPPRFSGRPS
jgi:enoyl-CoA hydratase